MTRRRRAIDRKWQSRTGRVTLAIRHPSLESRAIDSHPQVHYLERLPNTNRTVINSIRSPLCYIFVLGAF